MKDRLFVCEKMGLVSWTVSRFAGEKREIGKVYMATLAELLYRPKKLVVGIPISLRLRCLKSCWRENMDAVK